MNTPEDLAYAALRKRRTYITTSVYLTLYQIWICVGIVDFAGVSFTALTGSVGLMARCRSGLIPRFL